jgi:hypothetical protein
MQAMQESLYIKWAPKKPTEHAFAAATYTKMRATLLKIKQIGA